MEGIVNRHSSRKWEFGGYTLNLSISDLFEMFAHKTRRFITFILLIKME